MLSAWGLLRHHESELRCSPGTLYVERFHTYSPLKFLHTVCSLILPLPLETSIAAVSAHHRDLADCKIKLPYTHKQWPSTALVIFLAFDFVTDWTRTHLWATNTQEPCETFSACSLRSEDDHLLIINSPLKSKLAVIPTMSITNGVEVPPSRLVILLENCDNHSTRVSSTEKIFQWKKYVHRTDPNKYCRHAKNLSLGHYKKLVNFSAVKVINHEKKTK